VQYQNTVEGIQKTRGNIVNDNKAPGQVVVV
jgi:hypothetical protein